MILPNPFRVFFLFLCLTFLTVCSLSAQDVSDAKQKLQARIQEEKQMETNAGQVLAKAQSALNLAQQEGDQEAQDIASQAIAKAQKTLSNVRASIAADQESLDQLGNGENIFSKGSPNSSLVVAGNPPAKPHVVTPSLGPEEGFRKLANLDKTLKDREVISTLEQRYWVLEEQIKTEKDPLKRAELINEQTHIKSQIGTLEVGILDRYRQEQANAGQEEKDRKLKALLVDSATDAWSGDYSSSVSSLQEALKADPGNKGIQQAMNYVNYMKDMEEGSTVRNSREAVLFDALAHGEGDWNKIISNVRKASEANPDDTAIRDALNIIEGMKSYNRNTGDQAITARLNRAGNLIDDRNYEGALSVIKEAHELYPDDAGVRDIMWWMQGVCNGQKIDENARAASSVSAATGSAEKGFLREKSEADKLVSKAMSYITRNDFESAVPLLKKANELDPKDNVIRDTMNFARGASCFQYQQKKSTSQTNP